MKAGFIQKYDLDEVPQQPPMLREELKASRAEIDNIGRKKYVIDAALKELKKIKSIPSPVPDNSRAAFMSALADLEKASDVTGCDKVKEKLKDIKSIIAEQKKARRIDIYIRSENWDHLGLMLEANLSMLNAVESSARFRIAMATGGKDLVSRWVALEIARF